MDRKVVKRVVMTVPYNAKPFSNRGYIRDALKEKGVEIEKEDLTKTVAALREDTYGHYCSWSYGCYVLD